VQLEQPVARTAFYCCVIRADDAALAAPVCRDTFADRFLDDTIRRDLAPILQFRPPALSNVGRHRIIDDIVRRKLASDAGGRIVILGAGFDTRAFRLPGGRWFELDDPQLLAFKESKLPVATAPNPLQRIPVTFASASPDDYLGPLAGNDEALVVLEGVSVYLDDAVLHAVATGIRRHLPRATLVCDLMTPMFARTFSRSLQRELRRMGARFGQRRGHPCRQIESAGYRALERISIAGRTVDLGSLTFPRWAMSTIFRGLRDGYMVWVFGPR
jgi:methyltransferase (TIGR00027 family)